MDSASEGAIFFSFGSNAKTTFLPREKVEMLLKVFAKLPQRVIMKWESDELDGRPPNVMIGKWLPQDGILAHQNVKLFISHCGVGSVVESKFFGVPIVGIPIYANQFTAADSIVKEGWGVRLELESTDFGQLTTAIMEVLHNPKYSENVRKASQLYRDRPMNARETATFWVEYVIRHRGAPHLQYPAVHQNLFQINSLDVIAFLLAVAYVVVSLAVFAVKFVCLKMFKRKRKQKTN